MNRDVASLESAVFDVLVIGGGVVGACVAWDAAQRGLRVALVEREDFGGATSANSFKVVHGGLRYLQHLDVPRVRASIRERSTWLRIAPHLVEPLPIVVPTRGAGRESRALLRAALAISDLVGWDRNAMLPPERRLPPGGSLSRAECLALAPDLEAWPITGGVLFHDAQLYSAERLVLAVVRAAHDAGATVANYVECDGVLSRDRGMLRVLLRDHQTGAKLSARARSVVNAAGAHAARVAGVLTNRRAPEVGYSIAVNLLVRREADRAAFAFPGATRDGSAVVSRGARQLFAVPWRGRTLLGTGHFAVHGLDRRDAEARYSTRFLEEVNGAWRGRRFEQGDVALVHHGYLPLAAGHDDRRLNLLKHHRILEHRGDGLPELLTVVSTKLTTARRVAEAVVDRVCARQQRRARCRTAQTPLPGAPPDGMNALRAHALERLGNVLRPETIEHLIRCYGTAYEGVVACARELPGWDARVVVESPTIRAQLVYGALREMGCRPADLVDRRTEIRAVGARSAAALDQAARILRPATPLSTVEPWSVA